MNFSSVKVIGNNTKLFTLNYKINITMPDPKDLPQRCIVIGLPNIYLFFEQPISLSEMIGNLSIHKSQFIKKLIVNNHDTPINKINDIFFRATENTLYGGGKTIKYPDGIDYTELIVMFSGIVYSDGEVQSKHINIDLNKHAIMTSDNEAFLYDNCLVAMYHNKVSTFVYDVKLVKLSTCAHFMLLNKPIGYKQIHSIYLNAKLPLDSIQKCREEYYDKPLEFVVVCCLEEIITVPKYLKYLFGNHSAVFHCEGFSINKDKGHDIDAQSFKLLVKWLLCLVVEQKFPDADMIIKNEIDVVQWSYISNYFDIPCLFEYFSLIEKTLKSDNI